MKTVKHKTHIYHGMRFLPEYSIWRDIIQRCTNPNNRSWHRYGDRGISICPQWRENFQTFFEDMGPRPSGLSIDRINNNGNYEPENCRWATKKEQEKNHGPRFDSPLGIPGIRRYPNGKYQARIKINGKENNLGTFEDFFEACCARKSAELRILSNVWSNQ